jgi:hypothetical protein
MDQLFQVGTYRGEGRWVDQKAEGRYTAQYSIADGPSGSKIHTVLRNFLKPDGSVLYEENSTVTFAPTDGNRVAVSIASVPGTVSGPGYCFDHQCHYELDVTPDNHLEFTFHAGKDALEGLGSATNKGNFTSWRESLHRVD